MNQSIRFTFSMRSGSNWLVAGMYGRPSANVRPRSWLRMKIESSFVSSLASVAPFTAGVGASHKAPRKAASVAVSVKIQIVEVLLHISYL
jgi:hypothetical protein